MTTMDKARELGVALANSPEYTRLTRARERVDENRAVSGLIQEFQDKERQIVTMMEQDDVDREGAVMLTGDIKKVADHVIYIPKVRDVFMPITASVPLQLLARAVAVARGCDVDQPRNLAKSVTVE